MIDTLTLRHVVRLLGLPLFEVRLRIAAEPDPTPFVEATLEPPFPGGLYLDRFRSMLRDLGLVEEHGNPLSSAFVLDLEDGEPFLMAHASIGPRMRALSAHRIIALRRDPRVAEMTLA